MLSLQPGAPNVLEQGPERRNCHTTRVQLVSGGGRAPPGLPAETGHSHPLVSSCPGGCLATPPPQAVPIFWQGGEPHLC